MPGYPATAADSSPKPGLKCVHCDLLLKDPVQTEEGQRLCRDCFAEIQSLPDKTCKICNTSILSSENYPDKAVQREILGLQVLCRHLELGCTWQGQLKDWELHSSDCSYKGIACPHKGCGKLLPKKDLQDHEEACLFRPTPCTHCSTKLPFNQIQSHELSCDEAVVKCEEPHCGKEFKRKELSQHRREECAVEVCSTCNAKVLRKTGEELEPLPAESRGFHKSLSTLSTREISTTLEPPHPLPSSSSSSPFSSFCSDPVGGSSLPPPPSSLFYTIHLSNPLDNFRHHQCVVESVKKLQSEVTSTTSTQMQLCKEWAGTKEDFTLLQNENQNLKSLVQELKLEISALTNQVNEIRQQTEFYNKKPVIDHTLISKLEELRKSDAEKTATVIRLKTELNHLQKTVEVIKTQSESNIREFGDAMTNMGVVEQDSVRRRTGHIPLGSSSDSRMAVVEKRVEDLAKQMTLVKVHVQELELQLQASLASTHNGAFLWRIPDVSRRKRDAIEERVTSIYSPPFYTGRNGYKMCIRAYLNGDGMGYKTHLSLFFVLMKGECDPLLKWPFEYKISMILVDQTHRKHVVQTFKPTVESSSFQQPQTDMNVASGCPQFAKLNIFDDESYVKNDIMFIKCIVDTTKIFHP